MRNCQNKNINKIANRGRNSKLENNTDTKKKNRDLVDVMTKLEGKRPMCLEFCVRASGCLNNHFETHRKFIEEKYSALATANYETCGAHIFGVLT